MAHLNFNTVRFTKFYMWPGTGIKLLSSNWKPYFGLYIRANLCSHTTTLHLLHIVSRAIFLPIYKLFDEQSEKLCASLHDTEIVSDETQMKRYSQ